MNAIERQQVLERQLRNNPTDKDGFRELARIYRDQLRPVEARRTLERALEVFPNDETIRWEYEEAVLSRALQQFREVSDLANRLQSTEAQIELDRAAHNWALRRIEVCSARLERDPSLEHLYLPLGEAYFDAEQYEDTIEALSKVVSNDKHAPSAYLFIGKAQLKLKQDLPAMTSFRKAALRRAVPAPTVIKVKALELLTETANRLGISATTPRYQKALEEANRQLEIEEAKRQSATATEKNAPSESNTSASTSSPNHPSTPATGEPASN